MVIFKRAWIEYVVIAYEIALLLFAAWIFHFRPSDQVFALFSSLLGIHLTGDTWALLCLIGVGLSLAVLFEPARERQRTLYVLASFPLVSYSIAFGWYLATSRISAMTPIVYLMVSVPLWLLAFTTFRENVHVVVQSKTEGKT